MKERLEPPDDVLMRAARDVVWRSQELSGRVAPDQHRAGLAEVRARLRRGVTARRVWQGAGVLALASMLVAAPQLWRPRPHALEYTRTSEARETGGPVELLRFSDGSVVRLAAGTRGVVAAASSFGAVVQMASGRLEAHIVARPGARWALQAGPFYVESPGGKFQLGWSPDETTFDALLLEGTLMVGGPMVGSSRRLAVGERLLVRLRSPQVRSGRGDDATARQASALREATSRGTGPEAPALQPFDRSHWREPWRDAIDTWPASRMRDAVGVVTGSVVGNPSVLVPLANAGVRRVYVDFAWDLMRFSDPTTMSPVWQERFDRWMKGARDVGVRPVLLLYAYESAPGPIVHPKVNLVAPAPAGARRVRIDPAHVAGLVAGRTGIDSRLNVPAQMLFSTIGPDGTVTLSRALDRALPAGPLVLSQLSHAPFERPLLSDGRPNPVFEDTMAGWLDYVGAVARRAREGLGSDAFDVELWYKPMAFVNASNYYAPDIETGPAAFEDEVAETLVARTARFLGDPANGFANVRIFDNFSALGGKAPPANVPGIAAVARHMIVRGHVFPSALPGVCRALDARGEPDGARGADGLWRVGAEPAYRAIFPELPLTAVSCQDRVSFRDGPPLAITSFNLNATNLRRDPAWAGHAPTEAETWRYRAKVVLRTLSAYVGSGARQIGFYKAVQPEVGVVDTTAPDGGAVMRGLRRFLRAFEPPAGAAGEGPARRLGLVAVQPVQESSQFAGDGTSARPPLRDADVVAFFPFQTHAHGFVVPVYVMTRDLAKAHGAPGGAADDTRFDLPEALFRMRITGVSGATATVSLRDPLDDTDARVSLVERGTDHVVVEAALTDAPRLLHLSDGAP